MKEAFDLFPLPQEGFTASLAVLMCVVSFHVYWYFFESSGGEGIKVLRARFLGFLLMAVLPAGILSGFAGLDFRDMGLSCVPGSFRFMALSVLLLGSAGVLVTRLNPGAPKHFEKYPQIRDPEWTKGIYLLNVVSWVVYLTGYEIMFRGIVLFTFLDIAGVWPAVVVSTALYSAFHIQKGMFEALGAVFLGIVFAVVTILSGSIWTAVIIHSAMGVSNTIYTFNRHPDFRLT